MEQNLSSPGSEESSKMLCNQQYHMKYHQHLTNKETTEPKDHFSYSWTKGSEAALLLTIVLL